MAGYMPKKRPTLMDTITAEKTAHMGTEVGMDGNTSGSAAEAAVPTRTPAKPPRPVRTIASVRNWRMTSPRRAPMAFRTPIS